MRSIRLCVAVAITAHVAGLAGCATTGYSLVAPGVVGVGDLTLAPAAAWNRAPAMSTGYLRKGSEEWTKDGPLLDRLLLIGGVRDGETLFENPRKDAALPVFRAGMLANELEELTESSLAKQFGEGAAAVGTSGLRPQRFGEHRGVMFDLDVAVSDGPDYRGLAGAVVVDDRLYLLLYLAADPHYFDKHRAEAEALITSARLNASG